MIDKIFRGESVDIGDIANLITILRGLGDLRNFLPRRRKSGGEEPDAEQIDPVESILNDVSRLQDAKLNYIGHLIVNPRFATSQNPDGLDLNMDAVPDQVYQSALSDLARFTIENPYPNSDVARFDGEVMVEGKTYYYYFVGRRRSDFLFGGIETAIQFYEVLFELEQQQ